jgi:alkylation response protein AidB-like acyl-CoA dehydrogenase
LDHPNLEGPDREWTVAEFRRGLGEWLDAHHGELAPRFEEPGTLDEQIAQMQRVKAALYDAGWMRCGWPESVGGFGGSPMLRTQLGAAIAGRDLTDPGLFSLIEVLAPTVIDFAPPQLAAQVVPRLLSGEELWCQGFSEPGSGSDLASLRCRAIPDGDARTASTWVLNGQKVWTSLAQYSDRCVLLTRTGTPDSRHRGITAFLVDMDTPGIRVAPIEMINGVREFAEVFFDDVAVPADRMLGELHGGWAVAMSILPYERSSCFWQRVAFLHRRLQLLVDAAPLDDRTAEIVGDAFVVLHELRARSRTTQHRLGAGGTLGAETSIDKVLVARADQAVYDAVRRVLPGTVELDDRPSGVLWRSEFLYSRAATIYGGTAEIQRNIIARRLLDLGGED